MGYLFDGPNKIINLATDTITVSVRDLWSRYIDWLTIEDNSKYQPAMRFVGGDILPGSKELGLTYFMLNGWKIRPFEGNHTLNIDGNLYSEDGSSPYTNVLGNYNVMIINSVSSLVDSTVQQLPEIEYASYNGGVTLDAVNGTDSSEYPFGTPRFPCKTIFNSYIIRTTRGFNKVYLKSDLFISHIPDGVLKDISVISITGNRKNTITVNDILVTDVFAQNVTITGTFKEGSTAETLDCLLENVNDITVHATNSTILNGYYENSEFTDCIISGDISLSEGSKLSGTGIVFEGDTSSIDCKGLINTISLDIASGYVLIKNSIPGCLAEFNIRGGEIELDSTCIGGEFYVEGYGKIYNNSAMTIKANNLQTGIIQEAILDVPISEHLIEGSVGKTILNGNVLNPWLEKIEGNYTAQEIMKLLVSVSVGKTNIIDNLDGTATIIFKGLDGITNRITTEVIGSERTNITLNL